MRSRAFCLLKPLYGWPAWRTGEPYLRDRGRPARLAIFSMFLQRVRSPLNMIGRPAWRKNVGVPLEGFICMMRDRGRCPT